MPHTGNDGSQEMRSRIPLPLRPSVCKSLRQQKFASGANLKYRNATTARGRIRANRVLASRLQLAGREQ